MAVKNIKKDTSLRKAILQAAITGQLISDIGGESLPLARTSLLTTPSPRGSAPKTPAETGKQLLDRIIEERNKKLLAEWEEALKKNPKAKKPTPIIASEIDEDEIPFEIPENWCWCRLKDIFFMQAGKNISSSNIIEMQSDENPYPCFGGNGLRGYVSSFNKDGAYPIIGRQGALCGCINIATGKFYATEHAVVVDTFRICNYQWASWFLIALNLNQYATATAQPGLAVNKIETVLIPLPPLSVQNAIVAKLEQVLPLVDAYENAVLQKEELKSTLSDKVKKAILQEAITGKLTEEWRSRNKFGMTDNSHADADNCHAELVSASQESGEQLLDRIIKERNAKAFAEWEEKVKINLKAKKPVPVVVSEIEEDEIPFEIPESWCWCHLGEICNEIKRGKSPKYVDRSDYLAFAQKCNVKTGGIDLGLALYLDEKTIDRYSEEDNLIQGDVVINSTGGGTMGRVGYYETKVPDGIKGVYPDSHVTVIRSVGKINQRYLYYVLKHNQPILEDCGTGSTNQTELKPGILADFVIPLPPLEEQEEIVKRVEELLPLCK